MKIILSDLEGTLTSEFSSWVILNKIMGMSKERDLEIYNMFRNKEIDYPTWNSMVVGEWKRNNPGSDKLKKSYFINFFENVYKPVPYAKELINYARKKGYVFHVVSSGFKLLLEVAKKDLGFDSYSSLTGLVFDENDLLVRADVEEHAFNKEKVLEDFRNEYDIEYCVGIGDSDNDISLLKEVDVGLLINPSRFVNAEKAEKDGIIVIKSLKDVIKYLK